MTFEEQEIHDYLKPFGKQYVSAKEICRRAGGKKKWAKNQHWAIAFLNGMVEKNILESDSMAHYRVKPDEKEEKRKRWVSPAIAKMLKEKGIEEKDPTVEIVVPEIGEPPA